MYTSLAQASLLSLLPAMALTLCSQCQQMKPVDPRSCFYKEQWVCGYQCRHAAGDHSTCRMRGVVCDCTGYARKRRLLRQHRVNMRIMDEVISQNGLEEELDDELEQVTGNSNFWLGECSMDEDSDAEDPERALAEKAREVQEVRDAANEQRAFVEAAREVLQCRALETDVERARMQLEDMRGLR